MHSVSLKLHNWEKLKSLEQEKEHTLYDKSSSNGKVAKQQQTYYLDYTFVETTVDRNI